MGVIYVARSVKLCKWASDVGLGKNIFKVGFTEEPLKALVAAGWAGESDWKVVAEQPADGVTEEEILAAIARKQKPVDPMFYPKLKGDRGVFKLGVDQVENHIALSLALAGRADRPEGKLLHTDFAAYLLHHATR